MGRYTPCDCDVVKDGVVNTADITELAQNPHKYPPGMLEECSLLIGQECPEHKRRPLPPNAGGYCLLAALSAGTIFAKALPYIRQLRDQLHPKLVRTYYGISKKMLRRIPTS